MIAKVLAEGLEIVGADPSSASDALGLDSLQVVTLVDHLENELGILFDGTDVTREHFYSRATLTDLLTKKVAGS